MIGVTKAMSKLNIPVLIGTTRQQRKSIHAAQLIVEVGNTFQDVDAFLVDPVNFTFEGDGNDPEGKDMHYTAITEKADGFFIVAPEYNHSFSGSLKRMLDSELENYIHKPVAFAGVSSGQWGGVRAIEALVTSVREMGLVSTFTDIQFPKVQELFSDEGILQNEAYREYVKGTWTELIWMTKVLKYGRDNEPNKHHSK